jgi:hypothetical protein
MLVSGILAALGGGAIGLLLQQEKTDSGDPELERLVTTEADAWSLLRRLDPWRAEEREHRREVVLAARARAEDDIASGEPRIMLMGLTTSDCPDVDPNTGYRYLNLGCTISEDDPLDGMAYNLAIHRARREGRIPTGSFHDRFVTLADATAWLRTRGTRIERGGEGVPVPGSEVRVRIPSDPCGSRGGGDDLFDIDRPSIDKRRVPGWPSLGTPSALVAFREDGKAYVVAEPADVEAWTTCHVFDTATGLHLHSLHRPSER